MAYGRLDVFWPDGRYETFALSEDNVSVGRSTGNTIALETDTISRYHLSITHEGAETYVTDLESANGTFIDGVRQNAGERVPLHGGEELQIGYLRMLYYVMDETPTVQISPLSEDTERIERETPDFRLELSAPPIAVAPGAYTSAEVVVINTGDTPQVYTVQVSGMPEGWVRVNRPVVELDANGTATVLINIKPLRRSDSTPGVYTAQVTVRLQDQPEKRLDVPFKVTILAYGGFGMALATKRIGVKDALRLHIHNQGSAPLPIQFFGRDAQQQLQYTISPAQVTLAPGQRLQVQGEVKSSRTRFLGGTQEYPFDLVAQSLELPRYTVAVQGYLLDKSSLPVWSTLAMIGGAVVALALIVFGVLALFRTTPEPRIMSFTVNNGAEEITQGIPLQLQWEVEDAEYLDLLVNDRPIREDQLASEAASTELSTEGLSGEVVVSLIAESQDRSRTTRQDYRLSIRQAVTITTFAITPLPIVRNVIQTLTLTYDVPGATSVTFDGLDAIAQSTITVPPGSANSFPITVLPAQDFSVTLNAADASGAVSQQTLNIALADPECTPLETSATLYAAPDVTANVVSTVPDGATLIVDARDATGEWLRAQPSGIEVWGQRSALDCADTFRVEDLRQVVVSTNITATLVPTSTISPPLTVVATPTVNPTGG